MKKVICLILCFVICVVPCFNASAYNPPVTVVNVPEQAAVIDGVATRGEWDDATGMVLNISDTTHWEGTYNPPFLGNIYPPADHTDEDFYNVVKLMVKDGILYYYEERIDSTPYYYSDNDHHPYCQDDSLVWFILPDGKMHSISVFADFNETGPFIVFNENDSQEDGPRIQNCRIVSTLKENGHVIEAAIPLSELKITENDFRNGLKVTYCTVNIFNYWFDGNNVTLANNWVENGYEGWYTGVTSWENSPVVNRTAGVMYGDVTQDGSVDATDSLKTLQYSISAVTFSDRQYVCGDVNLDGSVNSTDALNILQYSVEIIDRLPMYR